MRPVWNIHYDADTEVSFTLNARLRAEQLYNAIVAWAVENEREWTTATATHSVDGTIYYFELTGML
jgi:hypothetical protein